MNADHSKEIDLLEAALQEKNAFIEERDLLICRLTNKERALFWQCEWKK